MNVLVTPEDFRKDQYILKPLFERLFTTFGRRSARIRVCQDPLLGGIGEAMKAERIAEIVNRYDGMIQIFILCVDRDGKVGRRKGLDSIEGEFGDGRIFVAENAWEELETWVLAGLDLPEVGVGRKFERKFTSRNDISSRLPPNGASPTVPVAAARHWGRRLRANSPRSAGSAQRTSTPWPNASRPRPLPVPDHRCGTLGGA